MKTCRRIATSRNLGLLYASGLIEGIVFYLPVLALYYEKGIGGSISGTAGAAIVFAVEALAQVAFEIPTGAIADLFGRKRTLVLKRFAALGGLALLFVGGSMPIFILWAIVSAFARSLGSGTDSALIYDTLKEQGREAGYARAIGIYGSLWPLGAAIGSIAGGYLAKAGLRLTVAASALPLAIVLVITLFLKEAPYRKADRARPLGHMAASIRSVLSSRRLLVIGLALFVMMAFGESVHLMSPLFFEYKELPLESFGWITAATFGLSSLGFILSHSVAKRLGSKAALILVTVLSPSISLFATFLAGLPLAMAWVSTSLLFGIKNPILSDLINQDLDSSQRATINSINNFAGQLGLAIAAPLIFGLFAEGHSILAAVRLCCLLLFGAPLLLGFLRKRPSSVL